MPLGAVQHPEVKSKQWQLVIGFCNVPLRVSAAAASVDIDELNNQTGEEPNEER